MKNETRTSKRVAATGIIAALAASSCCIPPIIAAIAGVGGAAGSLSWISYSSNRICMVQSLKV